MPIEVILHDILSLYRHCEAHCRNYAFPASISIKFNNQREQISEDETDNVTLYPEQRLIHRMTMISVTVEGITDTTGIIIMPEKP